MIWNWTCARHEWAIKSLVRAWLGTGLIGRILIVLGVCFLLFIIWIINAVLSFLSQIARNIPFAFLLAFIARISGFLLLILPPLTIIDAFREWLVTRRAIATLRSQPDVSAATRAEYLGGHAKLPHGRFVYLTLNGTLQDPYLSVVLPQEHAPSLSFPMPIVEVDIVKRELVGEDTAETAMLTAWGDSGRRPLKHSVLRVQYAAAAGRRRVVEFRNFWGSSTELINWRNYITCIQAEADTGEPPYGPWKTLPAQ